jgi:hypothetical protein
MAPVVPETEIPVQDLDMDVVALPLVAVEALG